jgi:tyrosyl-tRNA synthetase
MLHGEPGLRQAVRASEIFFGAEIAGVAETELLEIFSDVPSSDIPVSSMAGDGVPVADLLVAGGVVSSKGEARRAIEGGGIYLNNVRVTSAASVVTPSSALHGKFIVFRKGARNYTLIRLV